MDNPWILIEEELPPKDGIYEVTCYPGDLDPYDKTCMQYDGIGFSYISAYRNPKAWRFIVEKQKRYGKL